jgi:hypothetical protein
MSGPVVGTDQRRALVVDAAKVFLALGVADSRLEIIARGPGDSLAAVVRSENIVLAIDESLPMSWFRERFAVLVDRAEESRLAPETLYGLAAMLARRAKEPARVDRIEFIATRLLTRELPDGQLEALPEARFFEILDNLQLGIRAGDDVRDKAVAFFVDAATKLQRCASVGELLGGGLYLELQGYKKALREKRLDPAVLYASVLVSVAITNHLLRFAAGEGIAHRTLLARVASTELDAEKILAASEDVQSRRRRLQELAGRTRRNPAIVLGVAAGVAAAVLILGLPSSPAATLSPLPAAEVTALSPLLVEAALSDGEDGRLLVVRVDTTQWVRLRDDDRREAVRAVGKASRARGATHVLLFDDAALVGHAQGNDVLFVLEQNARRAR